MRRRECRGFSRTRLVKASSPMVQHIRRIVVPVFDPPRKHARMAPKPQHIVGRRTRTLRYATRGRRFRSAKFQRPVSGVAFEAAAVAHESTAAIDGRVRPFKPASGNGVPASKPFSSRRGASARRASHLPGPRGVRWSFMADRADVALSHSRCAGRGAASPKLLGRLANGLHLGGGRRKDAFRTRIKRSKVFDNLDCAIHSLVRPSTRADCWLSLAVSPWFQALGDGRERCPR